MNLLPMQYYLAVVKARSISRAAASLHVTQQTLSAHMAAIERELGCRLFERPPRFALTDAGRRFQQYAERFCALDAAMHDEFRDLADGRRGTLAIGIAPSRGRYWMPRLIPLFHRTHPDIEIHLIEATNAALAARLKEGDADIIIAQLEQPQPGLHVEAFYEEEIVLLVPLSLLPADWNDAAPIAERLYQLRSCPFIRNSPENIYGRLGTSVLETAGIVPHTSVTAKNIETILELCARGEGACFVSPLIAKQYLSEGEWASLAVLHLGIHFPLSLAWQEKPYVRQAILQFAGLSQEEKSRKIRRFPHAYG